MKEKLTKKQREVVAELNAIYSRLAMDHWNILEYDRESRTVMLELQRDQIIRSAVIVQYTLIDEYLNNQICKYFFGTKKTYRSLRRTGRFQNFNYHILENLSLLQKLRLIQAFLKIPKNIAGDIERINSVRNSVAHAFFPEQLRKHKPVYKGKNIFSLEGVSLFIDDADKLNEFFMSRF